MTVLEANRDRTINYIELNVADISRSNSFYARAIGWTFTDYGPEYCKFTDGSMKGGFDATGKVSPGGPLVVLYGDDLDEIASRIKDAGGQISKPVFDFPGGRRFHFIDPDGYELAVWTAHSTSG
jgi:predicted enzyme related to lactoylglutathione lyase